MPPVRAEQTECMASMYYYPRREVLHRCGRGDGQYIAVAGVMVSK